MTVQEFYQKFEKSRYLNFIAECRQKAVPENKELHHIYLKSFEDGKIDEPYNLIKLSVEDHIRAHILLLLSFEDLGLDNSSISYQKAANAVDICCNVQWKKLSSEEKENLLREVPNLATIKQKALELSRERVHQINAEHWSGDSMGMCHTEEAIQKSLTTRTQKFGNPAGATHNSDVVSKRLLSSKKTHIERYGGMTVLMNTEEARKKALETKRQRYGKDICKQMHTEEARKKALKSREASGFRNSTEHMNTPEIRKKAAKTIEQRFGKVGGQFQTPESKQKRVQVQSERRQVRMKISKTEEFLSWYGKQPRGTFSNKLRAVSTYLQSIGKDLEDFK